MTAAVPASSAAATPARRFAALDGLRGVCAVAIVVTHVAFQSGDAFRGLWGGPLSRLGVGRALLFMLSGFLLYQSFARANLEQRAGPSTASYLWRRFLRIMPAYWVMMAALVLVEHPDLLARPLALVQQALLAQTLTEGAVLAGSEQTWSLSVEAMFYLALPVLAVASSRWTAGAPDPRRWAGRQLVFCAALVVASMAWKITVHTGDLLPAVAVLWLPYQLDLFAVGMALAVVMVRLRAEPDAWPGLRRVASAPGTCLALFAALYWLASTDVSGPRSLIVEPDVWSVVARQLLYGACAACLLLPAALSGPGTRYTEVLGSRPVVFLGRISYGIFLWHMLVLAVVADLLDHDIFTGRFWTLLSLTLAVSIALAQLSYRLVESRAMRWRHLVPPSAPRSRAPTG